MLCQIAIIFHGFRAGKHEKQRMLDMKIWPGYNIYKDAPVSNKKNGNCLGF